MSIFFLHIHIIYFVFSQLTHSNQLFCYEKRNKISTTRYLIWKRRFDNKQIKLKEDTKKKNGFVFVVIMMTHCYCPHFLFLFGQKERSRTFKSLLYSTKKKYMYKMYYTIRDYRNWHCLFSKSKMKQKKNVCIFFPTVQNHHI